MDNTQIIILAAGKGTRMESEDPKALALLKGKPFLQYILETLSTLNLNNQPIIVVGYRKERIFETLGKEYRYVVQEQQLGTGHAVKSALEYVDDSIENIMVFNVDHPLISAKTIQTLVDEHIKLKPVLTMATATVPDFKEWRSPLFSFGRIVRDEKGNLEKIRYGKDLTEAELNIKEVDPAYFCFDKKWLIPNIEKLDTNNSHKEYYLTDLIRLAISNKEKIGTISIDPIEALGVNTKENLETLESVV